MDFFSAVADPSQPIIHNDRPFDSANDSFAEAIASRFGSSALLTTRLTPVTLAPPTLRLPSSPMANMSLAAPPRRSLTSSIPPAPSHTSIQFTTITTNTLGPWTDDPTALILDIRPHAAYSTARVPRAVSLSVPSTLLKRPLFSLHRLADMLPSANARARFSSWRSASRILVYDADSSAILESSNIYGLLRKFKNDGFQGDLAWLKGGLQAVWREKRDIIDTHPPTPDAENDDDDDDEDKSSPSQTQSNVLRTRHLPMAAFSFSSTTVSSSPSLNSTNTKRGPLARGATFPKLPTPSQNQPQPAYNPFFDAVRQNLELSQGITERIPLRLPRRVRHRIHDLPFPWLREIARRAAKLAPRNRSVIDSSSSTSDESEDDENITSADVEEGKEALAMQFFKIEVTEQRRLMGIMEHHTKETTIVTSDMDSTPASSKFPYSITAGVEKGAKNRYRHIWPFEHARVKLHRSQEADDDYVNASYVQPISTNKRYIATQGPLPATFTDFWTLCWEQNVHVIVMLTREVENSMVKCGSYWTDTTYGPLRLRLVSTTGASPPAEEPDLFPARPVPQRHLISPTSARIPQQHPGKYFPRRHTTKNETIRRVFELTHTRYPDAQPRRIIHFQYLEWPDMNVPDDPRSLLELLREVDDAVKETQGLEDTSVPNATPEIKETPTPPSTTEIDESTGISKQAMGKIPPVLLHCSAGVGRTGGFIVVDAVLDAIRRELRKKSEKRQEVGRDENAMEVDVPSGSSPAPVIVSSVAAEKDDPMSDHGPSMETISITITAGNEHRGLDPDSGLVVHVPVVPTPSSDGTEPEASGSERENPCDKLSPALGLTAKTREWAENVSRADGTVASVPGTIQQYRQSGIPESGLNPPSSSRNVQLSLPSDESSSSSHSFLDLSNASGNANVDPSGSYYLPQSSSLATSISAGTSSPSSSPPKSEPLSHLLSKGAGSDSSVPPAFLPVDCTPARLVSQPLNSPRTCADDGLELKPQPKADSGGSETLSQPSSGWLGDRVGRRSPSPMARVAGGAVSVLSQEQNRVSSFTLRAPPYTGGISSDAEPPSRSVSPSADEGSVASQVSSYHSYLKSHHCQPIHAKSLPTNLNKSDKEKDVRSSRVPPLIPERLGSPIYSHLAPAQVSSGPATTVDYKKPRPLHSTTTPVDLSSLEEPICEVVQDVREQRMSLCQSLRQYVFVHAAILEGALMIVDEEGELMKERERERAVEMLELKTEPERREKTESSRISPEGTGTSSHREGEINGLHDGLNDSGAAGTSASSMERSSENRGSGPGPFLGHSNMAIKSEVTPSRNQLGSRLVGSRNDDYFGNLSVPNSTSLNLGGEDMAENAMETDFSLRPRNLGGHVFPPAFSSLQRPRHPAPDARVGKRSTSPTEHYRDGAGPLSFGDDSGLLKRPSVKRKQPIGESGEAVTRKRAQNESSSRERERGPERRLSNGSHSRSRDSALDLLTSGLVR